MTALTVPSSDSTSTRLIARIRRRESDAWQRLVSSYGPLVYGWARQAGLQASDAADVLQETFRAVAAGIDGFEHGSAGTTFRGWLWTIARNKIRDHFRRQKQRRETGGANADELLQQIPDSPPEDLTSSGTVELTHVRLVQTTVAFVQAEFEPRTWQAFWRVAALDQPPAAVAADLGMSVGALYVAKSRVLRRLREELAGLLDNGDS
jgi:RNA polymerase sigma-70 factor (ECF subfamily)